MEMKVVIDGLGLNVPKTGFGMNVVSGSYLQFRGSKSQTPILIGLADAFSLGAESSTIIFGHIVTDWFFINPNKHNWINNTNNLIGKKAEIEVIGSVVIKGSVDLKFTIFDKDEDTNELVSKVEIKSYGIQIANTKVRGILRQVK